MLSMDNTKTSVESKVVVLEMLLVLILYAGLELSLGWVGFGWVWLGWVGLRWVGCVGLAWLGLVWCGLVWWFGLV